MSSLQQLFRLISTHCAGDNESYRAARLPQLREFKQEAADACLAERVAELTCIPEPALPTPKRPKQKIIGTGAVETKNVQASRRKGEQDVNHKGRIQFPGQPGLVQGVPPHSSEVGTKSLRSLPQFCDFGTLIVCWHTLHYHCSSGFFPYRNSMSHENEHKTTKPSLL